MNKKMRLTESDLVRLIHKTLNEEKQLLREWFQYLVAAWNIYKAGRDAGWWMVAPPSTNDEEFAEFMARNANTFGGDRGKTPRSHMEFVNLAREAGVDVGDRGRGKDREMEVGEVWDGGRKEWWEDEGGPIGKLNPVWNEGRNRRRGPRF